MQKISLGGDNRDKQNSHRFNPQELLSQVNTLISNNKPSAPDT